MALVGPLRALAGALIRPLRALVGALVGPLGALAVALVGPLCALAGDSDVEAEPRPVRIDAPVAASTHTGLRAVLSGVTAWTESSFARTRRACPCANTTPRSLPKTAAATATTTNPSASSDSDPAPAPRSGQTTKTATSAQAT